MKLSHLLLVAAAATHSSTAAAKTYSLLSPDRKLTLTVSTDSCLTYSLSREGRAVLAPSRASMKWSNGLEPGRNAGRARVSTGRGTSQAATPFYTKASVAADYNSLTLSANGYAVEFRVYNQGAAYRFVARAGADFDVEAETAEFNFATPAKAWLPYANMQQEMVAGREFECQFRTSFENTYTVLPLPQHDPLRLAFLPVLVDAGPKVCITESDLRDYPGMFLNASGGNRLSGVFAPYPRTVVKGGHNDLQMQVTEYEHFLAHSAARRTFPWRIVAVAASDIDLTDIDLVALLAEPTRIADTSWIRPGKVAWDWWNDLKLYGVDFEAGVNTQTYFHYIDFASRHGIEYVILDEGWATLGRNDLFDIVPGIDLQAIVDHARERGVGIILWAGYNAFAPHMERVCSHYAAMGVRGFKVDFMDRDDQPMVNFTWQAAEVCARHRLLLDLHGMFKPAGLQHTFPNVVNFEGVHGLEQMKWAEPTVDQVTYDVTLPFIRMVAGPMDYTQGAMRNASRTNYRPVFSEPMSQGTRCRQLAEYVIFTSPLNMLCDNPCNYEAEPECTDFIAAVPTVWDESVPIDGRVGEYVLMARRRGDTWYVGGLTDWNSRTVSIDLSFLAPGRYEMTLFADGVNADAVARDFSRTTAVVEAGSSRTVRMAQGGGFAMVLRPVR